MEILETLQGYPDLIQVIRGNYLLTEAQGENFTIIGGYLINKLRSEDRFTFYNDLKAAISHKGESVTLPLLTVEELQSWEQKIKEEADNKEFKVSQAKNAGLRDSYRAHLIELAQFYLKTGDFTNTMKVLQRAKDLTITADQQYDLFSLMSLASLFKNNVSFAQNNAQKIINLSGLAASQTTTSKVIMGLCNMQCNNFKTATEFFLSLEGVNNTELASNSDLAVYILLCSMASMDRSSIKSEVSQSKSFLTFSEDEARLLDLIDSYLNCKFSKVMQIIERLREQYSSDYFISRILPSLCDEIRNKCLVQYLKAFKSVKIADLAGNFEMSEKSLEEKLSKLITDGKIDARIDAHEKVVRARQVDQKHKLHRSVLETAKNFVSTTQSALLKMSMIQEDVILRAYRN